MMFAAVLVEGGIQLMNAIVSKVKRVLTKDVLFTGLNQLWRMVSGPLMFVFIPLYLTKEIQGYWYTFISLSALAIFADLGFSNIVLQFSAHEFSHLSFGPDYRLEGNDNHLKRLSSFFMFVIKWASLMIAIVFPLILVVGVVLFSQKHSSVQWLIPWVIYLMGSAVSFFNTTLISFVQGCNQVSKSQRIALFVSVINTTIILVMLVLKMNLFALAIAMIVSTVTSLLYVVFIFRNLFRQMIESAKRYYHSWKKEFLGLLWKYAFVFGAGYFIFQIYSPLVFSLHTPEEAGKVGITLALWIAIFFISNVWMLAVTPKMNMLAAKKDWKSMDGLLVKNMSLSILTYLTGVIALVLFVFLTRGRFGFLDKIFSRFLGLFPMVCLAVVWLLQLGINALSIYLRSHKQEPLVASSIASGIYVAVTSVLCAKFLPTNYIFLGLLSSYIWNLPWIISIFINKRKLWHASNELEIIGENK
jgi:type IV secretory pathway TrbD component